jgi:hypothetical protein
MPGAGDMDAEPGRCAAVARLAADAVGNLKLAAALLRRHVVGVAIEADLLVRRVREAQRAGHADRPLFLQDLLGLTVLVMLRPDDELVAGHRRPCRPLGRTVAIAARTSRDTEMQGAVGYRVGNGVRRRKPENGAKDGGQSAQRRHRDRHLRMSTLSFGAKLAVYDTVFNAQNEYSGALPHLFG